MASFFATGLPALAQLEWIQESHYRHAPLSVPVSGKPGFFKMGSERTGITFTNFLSRDRSITNSPLNNGSGVALGDIDGDGRCDLYFCGLEGPNTLYRNLGNWKFEDVTSRAGVACGDDFSTGCTFADVDGDGDLDLLVNGIGAGTRLFFNNGQGLFKEHFNSGLIRRYGSTGMALADVEGDGDLDLYVTNFRTTVLMDEPQIRISMSSVGGRMGIARVNDQPANAPPWEGRFSLNARGMAVENGEPDVFYLNDGKGNFSQVPWTNGTFSDHSGNPISVPYDWGLAVMFRDLNQDLAPDIYVCNDTVSEDRIWINDGKGRFRPIPRLAIRQTSLSSMGVDFADIDRDGDDDLFVLDMLSREHRQRKMQSFGTKMVFLPIGEIENRPQYPRNTFFLNRGDTTFVELAQLSGIQASEWSWTPIFLDVDLDGYEDLLISNGFSIDVRNRDALNRINAIKQQQKLTHLQQMMLRKLFPGYESANIAFRNRGDLTFEDATRQWGFDENGISYGMALADLDNDGDLDVVINNLNAAATLYRNESIAPRVPVRLKGAKGNTKGVGARIKLFRENLVQSQEMIAGGRYESGDDYLRTFAALTPGAELKVEILWRSGLRTLINRVLPNHLYEIEEWDSGSPAAPAKGTPPPLFEDVSSLLSHHHQERFYNDFERQPLLPNALSQLGPGVSWFDIDGDETEDLVIGAGNGGEIVAYRNLGKGAFSGLGTAGFLGKAQGDVGSIIGWRSDEGPSFAVSFSGYETGQSLVKRYALWGGGFDSKETQSLGSEAAGAMALADVDGDGDLDLFVAGRVIPGRYPEAASSFLFLHEGGKWVQDEENCARLSKVGLVSGALFSDLNQDGFPELIVACEWGPIKIFANEHGLFQDRTAEYGLDGFTGWWNGIDSGDFNGDGRLDLAASNWGRNTKYEIFRSKPLKIFFGDFAADGKMILLESYWDNSNKKYVTWRDLETLGQAWPALLTRFKTHSEFASAGVEEILAGFENKKQELSAQHLETTVFINEGKRFRAMVLPGEAQYAPGFGINVGDFDGNGTEDLFLAQNFFAVQPETSRYDGGLGMILSGNGQGGFRPMQAAESGLAIHGEQRGSAVCDFDADGRLDLCVAQNGAATRLFRNKTAKPGLRVKLQGPEKNRNGIGAALWLDYGQSKGPVREIHGGSGYWSQDSAVQLLGMEANPQSLGVRWPGGKVTMTPLPATANEIVVDAEGKLVRSR